MPDDPTALPGGLADRIGAIRDWLIVEGIEAAAEDDLVAGFAERLSAIQPLARLAIAAPSLDPNVRGGSLTWTPDGALLLDLAEHGAESEARFRRSPIYFVQGSGANERAWNLLAGEGLAEHPILVDLAAAGVAHYGVWLVAYPNEPQIAGVALTLSIAEPQGFSPALRAALAVLLPPLALAVYRLQLSRIARDMLHVYVGSRTGDRVLAGLVRRGDGEAIDAAIFFADLKGFTALSERIAPRDTVAFLNERFDILDAPISRHGGEILKFMGDGLLAVFPLAADPGEARHPCVRALTAAREALAANHAANRLAANAEPVELDIALHVGEVFYGNIGTARRLDFTVIGPAVNLASRMEGLCDELGRNLVMSGAFARCCEAATTPLGRFALKGIAEPQDVFGTADGV